MEWLQSFNHSNRVLSQTILMNGFTSLFCSINIDDESDSDLKSVTIHFDHNTEKPFMLLGLLGGLFQQWHVPMPNRKTIDHIQTQTWPPCPTCSGTWERCQPACPAPHRVLCCLDSLERGTLNLSPAQLSSSVRNWSSTEIQLNSVSFLHLYPVVGGEREEVGRSGFESNNLSSLNFHPISCERATPERSGSV